MACWRIFKIVDLAQPSSVHSHCCSYYGDDGTDTTTPSSYSPGVQTCSAGKQLSRVRATLGCNCFEAATPYSFGTWQCFTIVNSPNIASGYDLLFMPPGQKICVRPPGARVLTFGFDTLPDGVCRTATWTHGAFHAYAGVQFSRAT